MFGSHLSLGPEVQILCNYVQEPREGGTKKLSRSGRGWGGGHLKRLLGSRNQEVSWLEEQQMINRIKDSSISRDLKPGLAEDSGYVILVIF